MGQLREHSLISEARMQRLALARLVASLALPELGAAPDGSTAAPAVSHAQSRTANARRAAHARWTC
jgi:hypothetical protein